MAKALFVRRLNGWQPWDEKAEALTKAVPVGTVLPIDVPARARNIAHHRKLFAMLQLIYENQSHYKSVDDILAVFKFKTGYTDKIRTRDGIIEVPRSISFEKMTQPEFDEFYSSVMDFVCTDIIPNLDRADLERELMEFSA